MSQREWKKAIGYLNDGTEIEFDAAFWSDRWWPRESAELEHQTALAHLANDPATVLWNRGWTWVASTAKAQAFVGVRTAVIVPAGRTSEPSMSASGHIRRRSSWSPVVFGFGGSVPRGVSDPSPTGDDRP